MRYPKDLVGLERIRIVLFGTLLALWTATSCVVLSPLEEIAAKSSVADAGPDTSADGAPPSCTSHAECSVKNGDRPSRCVQGACVALDSAECMKAYTGKSGADELRDFSDEDAIVLGAYANIENLLGSSNEIFNYRLVLNELSGPGQGGLPLPNGDKRPLVLVVCDNTPPDPGGLSRSLDHLIHELRVPAVLAALDTASLVRAFQDYGQTGTFFLSPYNSNQALVSQPDNDLLWHMLGQPADLVPAYVELLEKLEASIKAARPEGYELKVALIWTDDAFNKELTDAAIVALKFNGVGVQANSDAGNYLSIKLDVPQVANQTQAIVQFKPDVVLTIADNRLVSSQILQNIDLGFGVDAGTYYVLSPFTKSNLAPIKQHIAQILTADTNRPVRANERFFGISAAGAEDRTLYNEYYTRLKASFPNAAAERENFYDAMYFLAYAVQAVGPAPLSGKSIADGMQSLVSGTQQFPIGVGGSQDALAFLYTNSRITRIQLIGTLGPADFDTRTGTRVDTPGLYCFSRDFNDSRQLVAEERFDVMRYDLDQKQLRFSSSFSSPGSAPCLEALRGL
jgi:hypothetical protein